jgi:hypothetical protein
MNAAPTIVDKTRELFARNRCALFAATYVAIGMGLFGRGREEVARGDVAQKETIHLHSLF